MSESREKPALKGSRGNVVRLHASVMQYAERMLKRSTTRVFFSVEARSQIKVPLVGGVVRAGFPSPADDYLERPLCMNELLIKNPPATFVAWVDGDSMILAGIFPGDLAIVDRSVTPKNRSVVLARVNSEFTLKRYRKKNGRVWLQAESPNHVDIQITEDTDFEIWGVVHHCIHVL